MSLSTAVPSAEIQGDGADINSWGNVVINNSTFNGNSGDGATIRSPNTTISNSTFSNNATGASSIRLLPRSATAPSMVIPLDYLLTGEYTIVTAIWWAWGV
jgi:hypothetical protein